MTPAGSALQLMNRIAAKLPGSWPRYSLLGYRATAAGAWSRRYRSQDGNPPCVSGARAAFPLTLALSRSNFGSLAECKGTRSDSTVLNHDSIQIPFKKVEAHTRSP